MSILVNWKQALGGDPPIPYTAQDFRQLIDALTTEGVVSKAGGHLKVGPRGAGANLSVDVAVGEAFVDGDDTANQGTYQVENTAVFNLTGFAAAPGSGARIDLVVFRVYDTQAGGPAGTSGPIIVPGVASGSPAPPALPASSIPLAEVRLNAGDLSIGAGNITDRRVQAASPEASGLPIGAITQWLGSVPPPGWLILDGTAGVSAAAYPDLYAQWLADGIISAGSTFTMPDARGDVLVGRKAGDATLGGALGSHVGAATITLSVAQMPAHAHAGSTADSAGSHTHTEDFGFPATGSGSAPGLQATFGVNTSLPTSSNGAHPHNLTITSQGAGDPVPVVQPGLLVNHIVKAL